MKVIHLISGGDTGGAKTHIHYLLSNIRTKIDVTLVCFMEGEFAKEARELGIPTVVMEDGLFGCIRKLKDMIVSGGYEIIHSHGARGNFIASLLKNSCQLPMVSTVHSDPKLDYLGRPAAAIAYGTANAFAMKRADYLVGVSESMKSLLVSRGFSPNRVFTIYNGVDFNVKPENPDRVEYLRKLGLSCDEDSIVVGIAARLDPVKDVATLVRGFAIARTENERIRLVVAGDGMELQNLKDLSEELGVSDSVCFAGWLSDMNSFYAALDINTLTSVSETFPYAITEGARAALPTVSTRVGGVPRLVVDGETGFLVTPEDHETLGNRLTKLAASAELRKKLGTALYNKAKAEYSVDATTDCQINIYREILRREKLKATGERDGVVICGAYGMGNAGDDAILEAIVGEMRRIDPFMPIWVLSRIPEQTRGRYFVDSVHMFNYPAYRRIMKKTRLYISGGGSLIQNVTSRRSLWYYLNTISLAKKLGNAVMMYGCGIGPIIHSEDEDKVRDCLNRSVDVITLRESYSMDLLTRLGVDKPDIMVTSDPALTLPCASSDMIDAEMRSAGLDPQGQYVCFSVRNWNDFDGKASVFAEAADYVSERLGLMPVFMLINHVEDGNATRKVRALMKTESGLISRQMESSLTAGVISRMHAMVSVRLHGLIFAASQGVPLVGVSYDPKVTAFLGSMSDENCIDYSELDSEKLVSMIKAAISSENDVEARRQRVERLIRAESRNSEMARKLLSR